ncbi:MAG: hypothetical protein JNM59_04000 [Hyphomonadaceae bacterium]|nr:hypothetical protein [Hyphomonadaceae bacterium]
MRRSLRVRTNGHAADNIIAGTVVDGPAWRAGLRDGMRLIGRRGGEIGNPTVEIAYEIEDAQGRRVLSWMPQGARTVRFRQLNLAAAQQNGGPGLGPCGRRLAGL